MLLNLAKVIPHKRRSSFLLRTLWCLAGLIALQAVQAGEAKAFQLFWVDDGGIQHEVTGANGSCPGQPKGQPVLFVHGHPLNDASPNNPNFERNWIDGNSFNATLGLSENQDLDIEDYFIEFLERDRSILVDANKVGEALALIQGCQDPNSPSTVKVAIIGFSKGTISTRAYLRSRQMAEQGQDLSVDFPGDVALTPHSPTVNPVSEFIALASPNHGLRLLSASLPIRQLGNGLRPGVPVPGPLPDVGCTSYGVDLATGFMSKLNGLDNTGDWSGDHETPGSRANGDPVDAGTLFVSIYDEGDAVGGSTPDPDDCADPKRKQALNRGVNAENIVLSVPGNLPLTIHANTVKDAEVICRALYTVVHHRVPPAVATPVCDVTPAGLPIIPKGTGVVLALDHSGSMRIPACPGCGSKQAVLQMAVEMFLGTWAQFAGPKDKVGVTYFRTGIQQFAAAGSGDTLVPVLPDTMELITDLQAEATNSSGLTAMGAAVQSGILALQGIDAPLRGVGPNRHVILFTDGLQNVNPKIHQGPDQQLIVEAVPDFVDAGMATLLDQPIADYGVTVDTIGIGVSLESETTLLALASQTSGLSHASTNTGDLNVFFTDTLVHTLRDSSPQLVAYRYGTLADDQQDEVFTVNEGGRKIVLRLSWPSGADLDFRVEKDGIDVTAAGSWSGSGFYKIFALDLPAAQDGQPIDAGGEWRMIIRGRPGVDYEAAAIVDEPQFKYNASLGSGTYVAGDPLQMEVRLSAGARAIEGARVTANVGRPGDSMGNLLATHPAGADPGGLAFEPSTTIGQRNAIAVLQDEALWQRLQPVSQAVVLTGGEDGVYRGALAETTIPGTYTVSFDIEAEDRVLGSLRRAQTMSTQVRVAAVQAESSSVRLQRLAETGRGREVALRLTPRDRFGNHLGPDQGQLISVKAGADVRRGPLRDLGNGTYVVPLVLPATGDPEVTLSLAGTPLFTGSVSELEPPIPQRELVVWIALVIGWVLAVLLILRWLLARRAA